MREESSNKSIEDEVLAAVAKHRALLLDYAEIAFSNSPSWAVIRTKLLNLLGDRGLTGAIRTIYSSHSACNRIGRSQ